MKSNKNAGLKYPGEVFSLKKGGIQKSNTNSNNLFMVVKKNLLI